MEKKTPEEIVTPEQLINTLFDDEYTKVKALTIMSLTRQENLDRLKEIKSKIVDSDIPANAQQYPVDYKNGYNDAIVDIIDLINSYIDGK